MNWTVEVDDDWSPDDPKPDWSDSMGASAIHLSEHDASSVNAFPGDILDTHKDVLFIFIDNPSINSEDVFKHVNKRIRDHIRGLLTIELRIVTQDENSLFDFFGWNKNRRINALIKGWKEVDSSFAPTISFENYIGESI